MVTRKRVYLYASFKIYFGLKRREMGDYKSEAEKEINNCRPYYHEEYSRDKVIPR